ncbi:hypothetical protein A2996_02115 [Candidatus Campbellbacteria bacterium RIFCSPLOWO2_01_FULL_34_15]|uniref:Polysaccharide biosynthesis protein C-terminal domain-containing protein n=2 Tax=Candidatus Campbelliibacteriota TaxID=1752727 RepID=A0A1F5ELW5_9BACT|nr:MAG: hypothetical protein A2811_00930 [Candidatus Campbellbacteria bacterium RIFCSPHIGHO2_01_FULL_34_10]OGD68214.1 MAG: hypothetical protein A2996_02115 [Candidatus Campbellbacteria bacterium RIFCSPLOWO2_01_FULL_34_15]
MKKIIENYRNKTYKFLRWSEKWTKTDMIYLTKGGFWLTLGQIFSSLSAFLLAIAFANLVPKEIYGNYKYILSVIAMLSAFSLTGIATSIIKDTAQGFEGSLKEGFKENLKWGVIMMLLSSVVALYYGINQNLTLAISILIAGASYPLIQSASFYGSFLGGKREFQRMLPLNIIRGIFPTVVIFITIIFTDNVILIITNSTLAQIFITINLFIYTVKKWEPNNKISKENKNLGKHLSLMNLFGTLSANLDNILIFHFFGGVQLAIYTFAIAVPKQFIFIKKGLASLALPKVSERNIEELKRTMPDKTKKFLFLLIPLVILYILATPIIYKIFFPQYLDSIIYSQVYSLFILTFPVSLFGQALIAHANKKDLYLLNIIPSVIRIILLIILLPILGIWGAVTSFLITKFTSLFLSIYFFKKL